MSQGAFYPMYEQYRGLIVYKRKSENNELLVIVNFTDSQIEAIDVGQNCVLCNYKEIEQKFMRPYEAGIYCK